MPLGSLLRRADGFGSLVGIVTICRLELVDKRDVFLISICLRRASVYLFLPCLLLRFPLKALCQIISCMPESRWNQYLEVKHAWSSGLRNVLAVGDFEESIHLP